MEPANHGAILQPAAYKFRLPWHFWIQPLALLVIAAAFVWIAYEQHRQAEALAGPEIVWYPPQSGPEPAPQPEFRMGTVLALGQIVVVGGVEYRVLMVWPGMHGLQRMSDEKMAVPHAVPPGVLPEPLHDCPLPSDRGA